ncbi:hypothetical protein D9M72_531960 [compost metagenome]
MPHCGWPLASSRQATRPWKVVAQTWRPLTIGRPVTSFRRSISDTPFGYETALSQRSTPLPGVSTPSLPPGKPITMPSPANTIPIDARRFSGVCERW